MYIVFYENVGSRIKFTCYFIRIRYVGDTYLNNILRFMSFEITYFLLKAFHFHKKSNQLPQNFKSNKTIDTKQMCF